VLLQILQYKTILREVELEIFAGVIALTFLIAGFWLGFQYLEKGEKQTLSNTTKAKELNLSQREIEVLLLLSKGHSNQEIADELFVSLNTIKTHISKIYQKLNVSRRTQAVQKAGELGLIETV